MEGVGLFLSTLEILLVFTPCFFFQSLFLHHAFASKFIILELNFFTSFFPLQDGENKATMASQSLQYDKEWAESLVGLLVMVPEYWWVAHRGRNLHNGKISSFEESQQKWMFVCDLDP